MARRKLLSCHDLAALGEDGHFIAQGNAKTHKAAMLAARQSAGPEAIR
jgi:hypothetical protein